MRLFLDQVEIAVLHKVLQDRKDQLVPQGPDGFMHVEKREGCITLNDPWSYYESLLDKLNNYGKLETLNAQLLLPESN